MVAVPAGNSGYMWWQGGGVAFFTYPATAPPATPTAQAALLLWLLVLLPDILPALALAFSFHFLKASADFLFFLRGGEVLGCRICSWNQACGYGFPRSFPFRCH